MLHSDCGAYGGLAGGFGGDTQAEANHHEEELRRATASLRRGAASRGARLFLWTLEGIWDAEIGTVAEVEQSVA